jgi:hypothetical protein
VPGSSSPELGTRAGPFAPSSLREPNIQRQRTHDRTKNVSRKAAKPLRRMPHQIRHDGGGTPSLRASATLREPGFPWFFVVTFSDRQPRWSDQCSIQDRSHEMSKQRFRFGEREQVGWPVGLRVPKKVSGSLQILGSFRVRSQQLLQGMLTPGQVLRNFNCFVNVEPIVCLTEVAQQIRDLVVRFRRSVPILRLRWFWRWRRERFSIRAKHHRRGTRPQQPARQLRETIRRTLGILCRTGAGLDQRGRGSPRRHPPEHRPHPRLDRREREQAGLKTASGWPVGRSSASRRPKVNAEAPCRRLQRGGRQGAARGDGQSDEGAVRSGGVGGAVAGRRGGGGAAGPAGGGAFADPGGVWDDLI